MKLVVRALAFLSLGDTANSKGSHRFTIAPCYITNVVVTCDVISMQSLVPRLKTVIFVACMQWRI